MSGDSKGDAATSYVAMVRGINVGGRNRVAMKDLRELVAALPAEDVASYVQSGNVVFRPKPTDPARVAAAIEKGIQAKTGLHVTVLVRTSEQLDKVLTTNPFLTDDRQLAHLHVTFLATPPDRSRVGAMEEAAAGAAPDECQVRGQEVYLHCPGGYGKTKLNNSFLERKLGVAATTRNWRTVTTLAEMAHGQHDD